MSALFLGLAQPFAEGKRRIFSCDNGPGLTVSSQSSIQWPKTWVRGIFWGILAVLCSYICLSNRVQVSWYSEGYQPSLCRPLKSLTIHLLTQDSRGFNLASCMPCEASLLPCSSFDQFWFSLCSGSSVLCCAWGLLQSDSSLELAAISYQQNNSPRGSKNGIS